MSERQTTPADGSQAEIDVRDCVTMREYDQCIQLQREAFALPDMEISPRRHLIVTRRAGGWTLGAFAGDELVGFVHHLVAVRGDDEIIGYSHMMAVAKEYQNRGVGAKLKWAQRQRALNEGRNFIKWTWDPMQARNAHFNLNRLGVTVRSYAVNFYGTDYITMPREAKESTDLDSDRLFADWQLDSKRVTELAKGLAQGTASVPAATIEIPPDWNSLISQNAASARREQLRVRAEFEEAFAAGLICAGFARDKAHPRYLLYRDDSDK
jgi:predicted GNAT superfamily acetyltransferase